MSNLKNFLKFGVSGARPSDAFEIIEDDVDDMPSDEEEGEIIEEEEGEDDEESNNGENKEEKTEIVEKKNSPDENNQKLNSEQPLTTSSSAPKKAPKSFFRVRKITGLPQTIFLKILCFLTIKDLTSSVFCICSYFNKINLSSKLLREEKSFLDSEYSQFLHPKNGLSRKLLHKLLHFTNFQKDYSIKKDSSKDEGAEKTVNFFQYSCRKKYFNCAKFIITKLSDTVDIREDNNEGLKIVCQNGSYLIVKEIIRDKRIKDNVELLWECFVLSVKSGKLEVIKVFLRDTRIIKELGKDDFLVIKISIKNGFYDIFKHFYEFSKEKKKKFSKQNLVDFLMDIVTLGRAKMLKLIIKDTRFNIVRENNLPLRMACSLGKLEVVKVLIKDKRVDPSCGGTHESLLWSAEQGFYEIVKLLLKTKKVDPTIHQKYAYRQAVQKGFKNIAVLLEKEIKKIEARRDKKYRKELAPIRKRLEAENKRYIEEREKLRNKLRKKKLDKSDPDRKHDDFLDSVFGDEEVKPEDEQKKVEQKKDGAKGEGEKSKEEGNDHEKKINLPSEKDFDVNI